MKNNIKVLLTIFVFLFFSCSDDIVVVYDISQTRFLNLVQEHVDNYDKFLILDIRESIEYVGGHVLDALSYPLSTLENRYTEILDYKNFTIYVYGNDVDESYMAVEFLAKKGFKFLYNCEGVHEADYDLYYHNPIRLKTGFALAKEKSFQLVDYRNISHHNDFPVLGANFVEYPNLDQIINSIDYAEGYVIFSRNINDARSCAAEFINYGFTEVYYCIDDIMKYPEYFATSTKLSDK